jgi:hypothetical protein
MIAFCIQWRWRGRWYAWEFPIVARDNSLVRTFWTYRRFGLYAATPFANQVQERRREPVGDGCGTCRKCDPPGLIITSFYACSACGNKRCPHATDCELPCTNSNEPGQKGSVFE